MKKILLLVLSVSLVFGFFWNKKTYDENETERDKNFKFINKKTKKLINGFIRYEKVYNTRKIIEVENGKRVSEKGYKNGKLRTFIQYTKKGKIAKWENYE